MRVLVFDTETTGLPKTKILNPDTLNEWPNVVQFSYIIYDVSCNEIVNWRDNIIKVPESIIISEDSVKIHGITNEISANAGIPIEDALNNFFHCLKDIELIVGHNISFDINMVKVELLRIIYNKSLNAKQLKEHKHNLNIITNFDIYCTLKESIQLCKIQAFDKKGRSYFKYPKLIELHEKLFNVSPRNLHNSFNDILVTLRCFIKIKHCSDLLETCETFKTIANKICLL